MYAIIQTGGKQYRAAVGQKLCVESLAAELEQSVIFDQVLLIANGKEIAIGSPFVENAKVMAKIIEHGRGEKINIIKFKRRKHQLKHQGHRQNFTRVEITDIQASK